MCRWMGGLLEFSLAELWDFLWGWFSNSQSCSVKAVSLAVFSPSCSSVGWLKLCSQAAALCWAGGSVGTDCSSLCSWC